ncbi:MULTISPECIES: hypothetical protein [Mesonia]|uniref:Uncharacterized protein n=1 Tax=Mesonia oceanica TaxID=2687242 RepID=A0AC61Y3V0_9FLAO|nr:MULTISPECIES: hypothetical protein [Mesonia]MAN28753.1 hypothetical protein [Mesonia sp.]MAQ41916.1 hypothetical protein [Mesonia sp.]MBJ98963.1 hypothetical protein [Flavobacteriaceae bacterium]VVU99158.1 hypothetical protein FVB9532_00410 [Mesonia oceanica]|tara:strand:+ start:2363 stop:2776 length:414 start_codon:yes stop_codon:yes gene_type:complete
MKKLNWKNILWIIIEVMISVSIYYLIQWTLENTEFPFTNDMVAGVFLLFLATGIVYGITIFGFIKIDELITGKKLNIGKGILLLIIGAVVSIIGMNLLVEMKIIDSDFPLLLFILIVMTIPVINLNYGLRMKKTMHT